MRVLAALSATLLSSVAFAETTGSTTQADVEEQDMEIIGGSLAPAGKWPDTVAVLGNQGSCSGTLISPNVVLTAGHCIGGMTQVIANTTDYNAQGGARATIKSQTAYPNWQGMFDIGILVLNTPITGVTPRMMATDCTFKTPDFAATKPSVQLVGFGAIDNAAQQPNSRLYEVSVPVTDGVCNTAGAGCKTTIAPNGEFIAGGANKDSCNGDSGGPVYLNTARGWVVIGAVSRALDSATQACGEGGIYVSTYRPELRTWIDQTVTANGGTAVSKDLCGATPPPMDPQNPDPNNPNNPTNPNNPNDPNNPTQSPDLSGGCSTSHSTSGVLLFLGLAFVLRRRRR